MIMIGHVFVSYVRQDRVRVDGLCEILDEAGLPVWRDTASLWPGEDWRAKIRDAIRGDALVFLACFSRQSVRRIRSYQNEELMLAVDELRLRPPDRPWLIPVRFDDCQIPERAIGGGRMLADLQQADLFGPDQKQSTDRLVTAIQRIFGHNLKTGDAEETTGDSGPADRSGTLGSAGTQPSQAAKYVINIDSAQGIQIGDGNVQHNTF